MDSTDKENAAAVEPMVKFQRAIALIEKLDNYIDFLNKANNGPISIAHVHGWRCPQDDISTGERLRDEIEMMRKSVFGGGA